MIWDIGDWESEIWITILRLDIGIESEDWNWGLRVRLGDWDWGLGIRFGDWD